MSGYFNIQPNDLDKYIFCFLFLGKSGNNLSCCTGEDVLDTNLKNKNEDLYQTNIKATFTNVNRYNILPELKRCNQHGGCGGSSDHWLPQNFPTRKWAHHQSRLSC